MLCSRSSHDAQSPSQLQEQEQKQEQVQVPSLPCHPGRLGGGGWFRPVPAQKRSSRIAEAEQARHAEPTHSSIHPSIHPSVPLLPLGGSL